MQNQQSLTGTPVRMSFQMADMDQGRNILTHLVEERLVSGGTIVHAESINWIGGKVQDQLKEVATAYTLLEKLPLIQARIDALCGDDAPIISQYIMADEKEKTLGWIARNVR